MKTSTIRIGGRALPLRSVNTLIVGSGAAALSAAVALRGLGQGDIAVVSEAFDGGTSRNAGSDKQTYYKLSLAGGRPDSPHDMARDLWSGGAMHGDIALCEAAGSVRAFQRLIGLGVPFPRDRYGAFVGYKTDHDPRQRATSAGPLTSRLMFEALAGEARRMRIPVFDKHPVIALLTAGTGAEKKAVGAIALDASRPRPARPAFVLFNATNIVLGTGGPAGMYASSVYPETQTGGHGLALEIGAVANNLTESQFGLASTAFRWNLSGTYQQVIPRYISTDARGKDEREFLSELFPDIGRLATAIFLKGYQWPFDPRKIADYGSSLIDLAVYRETVAKGRRVFLDFSRNPGSCGRLTEFSLEALAPEARDYLERSGARQDTPIERLKHMNPPAIEVYRDHGIDLERQLLEIAVCAQHNNGGLRANIWWESSVGRLFPVGEVNGTHGVYRPGGSALNSGQVGSLRAAEFIVARCAEKPLSEEEFRNAAEERIAETMDVAQRMVDPRVRGTARVDRAVAELRARMSRSGAHVRDPRTIGDDVEAAWALSEFLRKNARVESPADLPAAFKALDLALTHAVYLEAIREVLARGGSSRGSYLVLDPAGEKPSPGMEDRWRYKPPVPGAVETAKILEIAYAGPGETRKTWVDVRPIPKDEAWFESVWDDFRNDRIVR